MLPIPFIRDQFLLYRGARLTTYEILTYIRFNVLQLYRRPPSMCLQQTRAGTPVLTLAAPLTEETAASTHLTNPAAADEPAAVRKKVRFVPYNSMWDCAYIDDDGDQGSIEQDEER